MTETEIKELIEKEINTALTSFKKQLVIKLTAKAEEINHRWNGYNSREQNAADRARVEVLTDLAYLIEEVE